MGVVATAVVLYVYLVGVGGNSSGPIIAQFPTTNDNCSARLNHLALDHNTGKVFLGGVNRLIQLDSALNLEECVITGPKEDSPLCHARGCETPDIEKSLTDNVNKILVLDPDSRHIIACGSIFQGACEKYKVNNISSQSQFIPMSIAANDEMSSTYAFIGPEDYNRWGPSNVLYVGTTFTNNGEYSHDVPAIASRNLFNLEIAEYSFSKQSLLRIDVKYRDHFLVKYIYGFNSSDYAYFVIVQKQSHLPGQEELGYVTRLARVCINDANYDSYTEVTLQCLVKSGGQSVNYNLIQDAKVAPSGDDLAVGLGIDSGDYILVGTFSPSRSITNEPMSKSAVCIYSMVDIEAKFNENIHMCFNGSTKYRNMGYVSGLILDGDCPMAGTTGNILNFCEVGLKISGVAPISATSAIDFRNNLVTSVTLATTERHTVVFLGTSNGYIKKILVSEPNLALEYEEMVVDHGKMVLPDTVVAPSKEYLYALTSSKVLKVAVEHCNSYSNCSVCLESKDPYCGWCSLERRCTVRSACQKASHSSPRWLSLGTGQQCIDFEQILPDRIPINQMTTNPAHLHYHGIGGCPRFRDPGQKILLPNSVPKEIVLEVENLPHPQVGHTGFQCIVNIEGAKMMITARVEANRYVICDKTTYSYEANTGEYEATVTIVWNRNHHVDTIGVILYKCDILGSHREHPDCSLCVTRHAKYQCTWCGNTCSFTGSCQHFPVNECPKSRIDMIKPLSGPIEGGTFVTIEGSNLGLKEEDVKGKIHIGETPCTLVEYEVSVRIVCQTGPSPKEKVAAIVIGNQAGYTESSVHFSYKNIQVEGVSPSVGPQSGGTQLAITGQYLNIGSRILAYLDDLPCHVNATQASSSRLTCITSRSPVARSISSLILSIDGANRTLKTSVPPFTYKQDPTIMEIKPLKSFVSGGRMISVHGTNLDIIQKPEMFVYADSPLNPFNKSECVVLNPTQMECPSPVVSFEKAAKHMSNTGKMQSSRLSLKIGFTMDHVDAVTDLEKHFKNLQFQLLYFKDPVWLVFPEKINFYIKNWLI